MQTSYKIIVAVVLILALSGLVFYFLILPTMDDIKEISDDVYSERLDLEKKYLKGQLLKKTKEDFEKIQPEQGRLSGVFINQGDELEFITALENLATTNNLDQTLRLGDGVLAAPNDGYLTTGLEIIVRGEFNNIIQYLRDLEKLRYYYNIADLTITKSSGSAFDLSAKFNGNIYILPETN